MFHADQEQRAVVELNAILGWLTIRDRFPTDKRSRHMPPMRKGTVSGDSIGCVQVTFIKIEE